MMENMAALQLKMVIFTVGNFFQAYATVLVSVAFAIFRVTGNDAVNFESHLLARVGFCRSDSYVFFR